MSFINDEIYKKMVSEELEQKSSSIDENSSEFMSLPKCEDIEETLVVAEEIIVDDNAEIHQHAPEEIICEPKEAMCFQESMSTNSKIAFEYMKHSTSLSTDNINKQRWLQEDTDKHSFVLSEPRENVFGVGGNEIIDDQDGDEETIATFVTAAGQQLALYAVEDSDEIFAVAVYDESGEPPTNFQFLMKADVERLIGEGAVRTVKKPTQIKKQLLTTQPPIFFPKSETMHEISMSNEDKIISTENGKIQEKKNTWTENSSLMQDSDLNLNLKQVPNIIYTTDNKQSDVTYLMMDNCSVNIENSEDQGEDTESDSEIMEQSTVQYILFEGDQSDSELTFDEIQATLQNMKTVESKLTKKQANQKPVREQNNFQNVKETRCERIEDYTSNYNTSNHTCNTLIERKLNLIESRKELLETLTDSVCDTISDNAKLDLSNGSIECTSPESLQAQFKSKRSRKQQLISVNREDSEIIIQPAALLNEEDNSVRKKGRQKRRFITHSGYHQKHNEAKRLKKLKHKEVEIIEIDVDEEESMLQRKTNVVEITIDDSKDKYSSDKENEIIMVGDSDDESQQSDPKVTLLQCQHCLRNFRQQRALETHLRVCSKSPSNAIKFEEQKMKHTNRINENAVKKQYTCKICQKKFDVVVVLARHVRSEHSQRKKHKFSKSSVEEPDESLLEETKKPQISMVRRVKRKRKQRLNCSWEVKKLNCTDCGRWFPSAALLRAHCLQHGTKKSEQQIRRCQVCKKLIKSRLLFIRHLKNHGNVQQNSKPVANIQKKLHTTRSVTRKITTLRKRGRPRKL